MYILHHPHPHDNNRSLVSVEPVTHPDNNARPRRHTKAPTYLSEYHCSLVSLSSFSDSSLAHPFTIPYPISFVISYEAFNPIFQTSTISYTLKTEPKNFQQAMKSDKWKGAVNVEFDALEQNSTWDVESLPPVKNVVGCK